MRISFLIFALAILSSGCSENNLLGQKIWTDEEFAKKEVGFGWNFDIKGKPEGSRYIDITITTDNSYQIEIGAYRYDEPPSILQRKQGKLTNSGATKLRRDLAQLQPPKSADLYVTLPNCPVSSHPDIEYYAGFKSGDEVNVTIIERSCETPESQRARQILDEAFAKIPDVDRSQLIAG